MEVLSYCLLLRS